VSSKLDTTEQEAFVAARNHFDEAQAHIDKIRALRETTPHFVFPSTRNATQRLSSVASLPPAFVETTTVALRNSDALVRRDGAEPEEIRDWMAFARAYAAVADEHEAMAQFLRHSVAEAKFRAGSEALTTYALAQRLAKRPETAALAPYVADMRHALGPRFSRKRKPAAPPEETPSPDTTLPDEEPPE
jgi:hypothetical protein